MKTRPSVGGQIVRGLGIASALAAVGAIVGAMAEPACPTPQAGTVAGAIAPVNPCGAGAGAAKGALGGLLVAAAGSILVAAESKAHRPAAVASLVVSGAGAFGALLYQNWPKSSASSAA